MAAAKPARSYVVFGSDDLLRRRGLEKLLKDLGAHDGNDAGITPIEGDKSCELSTVLDAVRTPSLLSPLCIVVVRDADEFVTKYRDELLKYVDKPSPDGFLVLECRSWKTNTKLHKALDKEKAAINCKPPTGRDSLVAWVDREARENDLTLGRGVAGRLCDLVGDNFGLLRSELDKLATFVAPRTDIQLDDVESLVGQSREHNVFGITDAIAERRPQDALRLWHEVLMTDRAGPYRAVGGLAYGVKKLVAGRALMDTGANAARVRSELRIWTSAAALDRQLKRFSRSQWEDVLLRLLRIEANSKSGLGEVEFAVEKLIVDMCAA